MKMNESQDLLTLEADIPKMRIKLEYSAFTITLEVSKPLDFLWLTAVCAAAAVAAGCCWWFNV